MSTVLIASDLALLRHELRTMIESPDVICEEAATGPEVLARVRRGDVDVVLCDLQMGAMGALAICMELRNDESFGAIEPVSFVALLDRRADVFLAQRCGTDGYVVKPLDALRVRDALRTVLRGDSYDDSYLQPATVRAQL